MKTPCNLNLIVALTFAALTPLHAIASDSGFIENHTDLQPAPFDSSQLLFKKQGLDLRAYNKLMIDEIQFRYADDSPYKDISQSELQQVRQTALASLQKAISDRYEIVDVPGPGVLHLRATITDIRANKKGKNLLSFTPVGLVKQGIDSVTGMNIVLRTVSAEVELCDSMSGERLIAVTDPYAGYPSSGNARKASWDEVTDTLDNWAQRLAAQLNASTP